MRPWFGTRSATTVGRSPYLDKKLDEVNSDRSKEELERMAADPGQTRDQRESAQRVLGGGK